MGYVRKPVERGIVEKNRDVIAVYANVVRNLVVGSLHKRGVGYDKRFNSALCHSRCHGDRLLFGNTHVDKLLAEFRSVRRRKPHTHGHIRRDDNEFIVLSRSV